MFNIFRNRDPPSSAVSVSSPSWSMMSEAVLEPDDEVTKVSPFKDPSVYGERLKKRGYTLIGRGYYSAVYGKEGSDRVIKVGRDPEGDGWLDYIDWATQKGYLGKWAPQVYSYKYHRGDYAYRTGKYEGSFYVAVVERLDKTVSRLDKRSPEKALPMVFEYAENPLVNEVMDRLSPGLGSFSKDFMTTFSKNAGVDVHGENIMLRKNGEIVINDPLSSKRRMYVSRRKAKDFVPIAA